MDTIPDREFVGIFHRAAKTIKLKGTMSPRELDEKLKKMQLAMMRNAKRYPKQKKKWIHKARLWTRLRLHGFSRVLFQKAMDDPYSIYAYALKYGYWKALKMKLKESERRIRGRFGRRRRR